MGTSATERPGRKRVVTQMGCGRIGERKDGGELLKNPVFAGGSRAESDGWGKGSADREQRLHWEGEEKKMEHTKPTIP